MTSLLRCSASAVLAAALCACQQDDGGPSGGDAGQRAGTAQQPPTTADELEQWLADGTYLDWHCEPEVHAARSPGAHGHNRICSNDLLAENADGSGEWPEGVAAVKELYADAKGNELRGYAVYLKVAADSDDGAGWYWYERIGSSVPADGLGDRGAAKSVCVSCHVRAGTSAGNTPTEGARDMVFTPVQ
jgi:hypothetical protein